MYRKLILTIASLALVLPLSVHAECPLVTNVALPAASDTGVWQDGVLNLMDVFGRRVLRYTPDGKLRGRVDVGRIDQLQAFEPRALGGADGKYVMQLKGGQFAVLNASFNPVAPPRGLPTAGSRDGRIDRVYTFSTGSSGDEAVLCVDLEQPGGEWTAGYVRSSLSRLNDVEPLFVHGFRDPEFVYCRVGYKLATMTPSGDIFLLAGSRDDNSDGDGDQSSTLLYRFTKSGSGSGPFDTDFGSRPVLKSYQNEAEFVSTMRQIEMAEMPVGLYSSADGSTLYILYRAPTPDGTQWSLQAVDPTNGERLGEPAVLPSRSSHLTVVAGPDHWAFLERDTAHGFKKFASQGLRFVPSEQIDNIADGARLCN